VRYQALQVLAVRGGTCVLPAWCCGFEASGRCGRYVAGVVNPAGQYAAHSTQYSVSRVRGRLCRPQGLVEHTGYELWTPLSKPVNVGFLGQPCPATLCHTGPLVCGVSLRRPKAPSPHNMRGCLPVTHSSYSSSSSSSRVGWRVETQGVVS
jgi:hypothetical protein